MSEVKWIKITTDIFNDEKMLLIESMPDSDSIIVIWFKLLSLAGKSNNGGLVMMSDKVPYTKDMLPILFRRKPTVITLALHTFVEFGMIEILDNDTILIANWEKHQNIDQLEKIRIGQRERQKSYREKQKEKVMLSLHNGNALESSISNSESISIIKKEPKKKFVIPTVKEVESYCNERKNNVNPSKFINFYESKGWMIGKTKMKKWKAAVRTWEQNSKPKTEPSTNRYNNVEMQFDKE